MREEANTWSCKILSFFIFLQCAFCVFVSISVHLGSNPFSDIKLRFSDTKFPGATSLIYNESRRSPARGFPALTRQKNHLGNLKKIPEVGPAAVDTWFHFPGEGLGDGFFLLGTPGGSSCLHRTAAPQRVASIWKPVRNADSQAPPRTFRVKSTPEQDAQVIPGHGGGWQR